MSHTLRAKTGLMLCFIAALLVSACLFCQPAHAATPVDASAAAEKVQAQTATASAHKAEATAATQAKATAAKQAAANAQAQANRQAASNAKTTTKKATAVQKAARAAAPADKTITASSDPGTNKTVEDGTYLIESAKNLAEVLDVAEASTKDGANIQTWQSNMADCQRWRIAYSEDADAYTIVNVGSGKALDVANGTAASGANIQQWAKNASKAQLWRFTKTDDGYVITSLLKKGAFALNVAGSATDGSNVELAKVAANAPSQLFWLVDVAPKVDPGDDIAPGAYIIRSAVKKKAVVDVDNASVDNGANIQLYQNNKTLAQRYYIAKAGEGFYSITNITSGRAFDVALGNLVPGSNVQQWTFNKTNAQKWSIRKNANGSYTIINKASGLALEIEGGKTDNNTNVLVGVPNGSAAQSFILSAVPLVNDGFLSLHPTAGIAKVVDVADGSTANTAAIQIYTSNGTLAQRWQITSADDGAFKVRSAVSGKYLTAKKSGKLISKKAVAAKNQQWNLSWYANGMVFVNAATGKALALNSSTVENGTRIGLASNTNAITQRFNLRSESLITDGMYIIGSRVGNKALDVAEGSKSDGANLQIWESNGTNAQKFHIYYVSNDCYRIVAARSLKVLDVEDGAKANGTNVQQWAYNGSAAQLWRARIADQGGVVFVGKGSKKALSVSENADENGANVVIRTLDGSKGQAWTLTATVWKPEMPPAQADMYNRANSFSSSTGYLMLVDRDTCHVGVFSGSRGNWSNVHYWSCVVGAPSTPTITGTYTAGIKKPHLYSTPEAIYCTQISGNYYFHSILASTSELGHHESHGCVRLEWSNAHWVYDNIPGGTTIHIY